MAKGSDKPEMVAFMVICEGQCDQIVETKAIANREMKDLKKMGLDPVTIKAFESWEAAEAYEEKLRSR